MQSAAQRRNGKSSPKLTGTNGHLLALRMMREKAAQCHRHRIGSRRHRQAGTRLDDVLRQRHTLADDTGQASGQGLEMDLQAYVTDQLLATLGVGYNDTKIKDKNLAVAVCAACMVTDPKNAAGLALIGERARWN